MNTTRNLRSFLLILPNLALGACQWADYDAIESEPSQAASNAPQGLVPVGVSVDATKGTATRFDDSKEIGSTTAAYAIGPAKWARCNITYKFVNYTSDISVAAQRGQIIAAFATWAPYSDLVFTETANPHADIEISWATGSHGDAQPFDGVGGILAHTVGAFNGGVFSTAPIHFDDAENWSVKDLQTVAIREIGHAIGLVDSPVPQAVMYNAYTGIKRVLDQDDIAGIKSFTPEISGPAVLCAGSAGSYSYSRLGATQVNWTATSGLGPVPQTGNPVSLTSSGSPSLSTITVTTNNACTRRLTVATAKPPAPANAWFDIVLNDGIHCFNNAFAQAVPGATSYVWTQPSSLETIDLQHNKPLLPNRPYAISVSAKNACGVSAPFLYNGSTLGCN